MFQSVSYLVVLVERRRLDESVAAQLVRLVRLQDVEHGVAPLSRREEPNESRKVGGLRFPVSSVQWRADMGIHGKA